MAEQSCNSPAKSTVKASHTADIDSQADKCHSSSCDSRVYSDKVSCEGDNLSSKNQSSDASVISKTENRNGVSDVCSSKIGPFLRPSALLTGSSFSVCSSDSHTPESPSTMKCPLKSPKLNLTPSRFGSIDSPSSASSFSGNSSTKLPFQQLKNPFSNAVSFDNEKNESLTTKNNVLQTEVNISGGPTGEKLSKPRFSSFSNSKPIGNLSNTSSSMLTTNFVFGQNLHERVADGIATTNNADKSSTETACSNGTSDMLFTSVLTSKEIQDNLGIDNTTSSREPFSLIEDAARCQEARANKRKYEEVLVTTGEEDEENILQVNVKLFAFDSGTWVERGRGTLRLNDKNCDGTIVSRIVIRTLGSLRVVLNTKIWSGMSLSRASERSIRLTAMDPNGQLKIFLIQASPKDMGTLYKYLNLRLERCQESQEEPEKKKLEQC